MTQVTNRYKYPQPLVDAVSHDGHITSGDISVTTLIDAPQIFYLRKKHKVDIQTDVSDLIWALIGTAIHGILERANITSHRRNALMEVIQLLKEFYYNNREKEDLKDEASQAERVFKWLLKFMFKHYPELESRYEFETHVTLEVNGWVVSGTVDLYDKIDKRIQDYKVTSTYMYTTPEARKKWKLQVNTYAYMLRKKGYEVLGADIIGIFRDWSRKKVGKPNYPPLQVMTMEIMLHKQEDLEKWILHRVKLHQKAHEGDFPPCSGEERWAVADQYAVLQYKEGKAISGSIVSERGLAEKFVKENQHKYKKPLIIEHRPSEWRKCESYCSVSKFCDQWAERKKQTSSQFVNNSSGWEG
jgi:hypothetical protein